MATSSHCEEAPSVWDDYEVIPELRKGGFGKVSKVKNKNTGDVFALREFKGELSVEEGDAQKAMEDLHVKKDDTQSPINVVQFIEFGNNYILMQLCDLGDLDSYYQEHMDTHQIVVQEWIEEMITGLNILHQNRIAHMDLKTANVMLHYSPGLERPICKLSDYGLSKFKLSPPGKASTHLGTPYYLAPKTDEKPMTRDVFSLGAIFFVLFSKQTIKEGNKTFLAPTINNKMLHTVEDNQIKSGVENLGNHVRPQRFRKLIIAMLTPADDGQRLKMPGVCEKFYGKPGSGRRLQESLVNFGDSVENSPAVREQ